MKHIITLAVAYYLFQGCIYGQTPSTDLHWQLNTTASDEFNYTGTHAAIVTALQSKWHFIANWGNGMVTNPSDWSTHYPEGYVSDDGSNVDVTGGVCTLTTAYAPGTYRWPCGSCWGGIGSTTYLHFDYTIGGLISNQQHKYGYYEVRFRLPYYPAHKEKVKGLGTAFWFFSESVHIACPPYQEIDVWENIRDQQYKFATCMHYWDDSCSNGRTQDYFYPGIGAANPSDVNAPFNYDVDFSDNQFHTVGFEWAPEYISVYVDGNLQRSMNYYQAAMLPMNIFLGSGLDDFFMGSAAVYPYNFEIDYLRLYDLPSGAGTLNICYPNYDNTLLGYTPRSQVNIGAAGCTNAKIKPGSYLVLHAKQGITLDEGFECDATTTMYMQVNNL